MSNVAIEMEPYFRRVQGRLRCSKKRRRSLLDRVHRAAEEFAAENPEATPEEVEQYLGDPSEVAQELMETLDPEELEHYQKRKKLGTILCIGLLVAALIIIGIGFIHLTKQPPPIEVVETIVIYD